MSEFWCGACFFGNKIKRKHRMEIGTNASEFHLTLNKITPWNFSSIMDHIDIFKSGKTCMLID